MKQKQKRKRKINEYNLELVKELSQIDCPILKYGLKKIKMNYYYCKTCDKENKYAICEECMKKCHKSHAPSVIHYANENELKICTCGVKAHYLNTTKITKAKSFAVCKCDLLNIVCETYEYYENENGMKLCTFCFNFCRKDNKDVQEFASYFKKRTFKKKEFLELREKGELTCCCAENPKSKHIYKEYFMNNLKNVNSSDDGYFPHLTPLHMLNMIFSNKELFFYFYPFFEATNSDFTNDDNNGIVVKDYEIFTYNFEFCKNFYFSQKINTIYPKPKLIQFISSKDLSNNKNIRYLTNFLKGYFSVKIKSKFQRLPQYSMLDLINLSPFQRIIHHQHAKKIDLGEDSQLLKEILVLFEELMKLRLPFVEIVNLLTTIFSSIEFFASFYLLSFEQIGQFLKVTEDLFGYLIVKKNLENENENVDLIKSKIDLISKIYKILLILSFQYNDKAICDGILGAKDSITFVHSNNDIGRGILKILTHVLNMIREELTFLNLQKKSNNRGFTKFEHKMKSKLIRLAAKTEMLISINFTDEDIYLSSFRRGINRNIDRMCQLIIYNKRDNVSLFGKFLQEEVTKIEACYYNFFQNCPSSSNKLSSVIELVENSLYLFFSKTEINFKSLPTTKTDENLLSLEYRYETDEDNFDLTGDDSIKKNETKLFTTYQTIFTMKTLKTFQPKEKDEGNYERSNTKLKAQHTIREREREMPYQLQLSNSSYVYCITKIFSFSKTKREFTYDFCTKVFSVLYSFISFSSDNIIIGLSSRILKNLSEMPIYLYDKALDYVLEGMSLLIKNKTEISSMREILKYSYQFFVKSMNCKHYNQIQYSCLHKFEQILLLGFLSNVFDKDRYLLSMQNILEKLSGTCEVLKKYKLYLIEISRDFKVNSSYYYTKRDFNNNSIFNKIFIKEINISNGVLSSILMFQIFVNYIKLLNYAFDGDAMTKVPKFVLQFYQQSEIIETLQNITINIKLRLEFLKFYRMAYIDIFIENNKMHHYREEFQKDLDEKVEQLGESLLPIEHLKIFLFLEMLLNVSESKQYESDQYDILLFEVKNIKDIFDSSEKLDDNRIYISYIENGILLPAKVYLNKFFSLIMSVNGEEFLKIYRFCFYFLRMKRLLLKRGIFNVEGSPTTTADIGIEDQDNEVRKSESSDQNGLLNEVESDIKKITSDSFQPLNYLAIFKIIVKHIMSLIQHPHSKELMLYFSEHEQFEENKKNKFRQFLTKMKVETQLNFVKVWENFEIYLEQKSNFSSSSIQAILDENYSENDETFRTVILKFLFYLTKQKLGVYSDKSLHIILKFLISETSKTQSSIIEILKKSNNQDMIRTYSLSDQPNINNPQSMQNHKINREKKDANYLIDFSFIAENCFTTILSSIFSQYNPSSLEISDDYYNACHIIKFFKFLCEEHNSFFQTILLRQISFVINDVQKITYYDMMLYVLEKIITLSSWENVVNEEEVQDYYYGLYSCIIEMLIEIVQGTDKNNFYILFQSSKNLISNFLDDSGDPFVFDSGKALNRFFNKSKNLMFNNMTNSETINDIRKGLMDFILAFIEEYNCPIEIKTMIMNNYHPSNIIQSISVVMKRFYAANIVSKRQKEGNLCITQYSQVRTRMNNILERNMRQSTKNLGERRMSIDKKEKHVRYLKFNETMYNDFIELYFKDDDFSNTKAFDLCCSFYKFFSLSYLQYKNEECLDFLTKIHSIKEDALDDFNKRTNINIKVDKNSKIPVRNDIEFEAYYVIKFFSQITKHVLVKVEPTKPPIYAIYILKPYMNCLSLETKENFVRNVDRKNHGTKLVDLMQQSEYFRLEIEYNWNNIRNNTFLKRMNKINYRFLSFMLFMISIFINIYMLIFMNDSQDESYGLGNLRNFNIILFFICVGVALIIVIWCLTKMQLYYELEKAKYYEKFRNKDEENANLSSLTLRERIIIRINAMKEKSELSPFIFFLFTTVIGLFHRKLILFNAFSLLSIVFLSTTLNNIILSIAIKGNLFAWTFLFVFIVLYVYAGWGYYFLRDRFYDTSDRETPEQMCESLIYCLLTEINNGLRWYPGVGKILRLESPFKHIGPFIHRFIHDFSFYWILHCVMLRIVFGIILDTFGELRQKHFNIENDIANKCFICDLEKDECEKNNQSFKEHCEKKHNLWDYAFYMITLRMSDPQDLNAVNSMCREHIMEKKIDWLPDNEAHDEEEEEEEKNAGEENADSMLSGTINEDAIDLDVNPSGAS